jgi:small subunit ribosomal protein S16
MSVTIRLSRIGRKNQPSYKLVVSNTRDKRNGRYVEVLGYYNPFDPEKKYSYNKELFDKWVKNGALVTDAVKKLIENKYEYVKYDPKKIKEDKINAQKEAEEKAKEVKAEPEAKVEEGEETKGEESNKEVAEETPTEEITEENKVEDSVEEAPAEEEKVEEKTEEPSGEVQEDPKGE